MELEMTLAINAGHEFSGKANVDVDFCVEGASGDGWNEPHSPAEAHINTIHASKDFSLVDEEGNTINFKKGTDLEHLFTEREIERIEEIALGDAEDDAAEAKVDAYIAHREFEHI
jgi:hypothetical protein